MQELGAIAGVASLVVTLATAIYLIGVWKGGVDNKVKRLCEDNQKYPPGETALMCKTMWDIYVVDALRERPDLAQHMSPFKLTEAKALEYVTTTGELMRVRASG